MADGLGHLTEGHAVLIVVAADVGRHEAADLDELPGELQVPRFVRGAVEFDDRPGPVRDALVSMVRAWQDALERAIRIAIEDGQLKPDTDAQQMLFEMHGLILALHHDARLMRTPGSLQRARQAYERVVNFYLVDGVPAR